MSPSPLGRFIPYLVLLASYCLAAEATEASDSSSGSGASEETTRSWLNRSEVVSHFPIPIQRAALLNILKTKNVVLNGGVPDSLDPELPELVENLVNGAVDLFFASNPKAKATIAPIVSVGMEQFKKIFGGRKVYITDMPPLVNCPDNIRRPNDKGRLSALVTWVEPDGYDIEDGVLSVTRRGKAPGSRFSGEMIIQYDTFDTTHKTDFCTFYITIDVVKCPLTPLQTHRINTCHGLSYYGDVCEFSCTTGYRLEGHRFLECTRDGVFNWPAPTCIIKTCPEPPLPTGGQAWLCSNGFNYNSVCTIQCAPGYRNVRSYERTAWDQAQITCKADGTWTRLPVCKDVTAPVITNCQGYMRVYADRTKRTAVVTWPEIIATDASGSNNVMVTQIRGQPKGSVFSQGAHEIAYEAVDGAGLKDTCTFYINIEVLHCDVPLKSSDMVDITCPSQFIYGAACIVSCLFQIPLEGSDRITCERNGDTMEWHYPAGPSKCTKKTCPALPRMPNGKYYCHPMMGGGERCSLDCKTGFLPARNEGLASTTCDIASGTWSKTDFAGCVKNRDSLGLEKKIMIYWRSNCQGADSSTNLPDVVTTTTPFLEKAIFLQACTECSITDIHAYCGIYRGMTVVYLTWSIHHNMTLQEHQVKARLLSVSEAQKVWLKANLNATEGLHWKPATPRVILFKDRGDYTVCAASLSPVPDTVLCAACGRGTIALADGCQTCPADTYQDDSGDATACIPCPAGTTTIGTGKGDAKDCKSPCPKGTDSPTGLTPCRNCSIGEYNDLTGQTACKKCPLGQFTPVNGSMSASDCYTPASEVVRLQVKNYGPDFVRLTWIRPDVLHGEHHGYIIKYRTRSQLNHTTITIADNRTETYEIDHLTPMTDYIFTVAAVNEHGSGVPRDVEITTKEIVTTTTTTTTTTAAPTTTVDPNNCPAGTSSFTGLQTAPGGCHDCDIGFYQPLTGQTGCLVCKAGFTTWYTGSSAESDCVDETWTTPTTTTTTSTTTTTTTPSPTASPGTPCAANHASSTGFEPGCRQCGDNKMPNTNRTACVWCPFVPDIGFQCP